LQLNIGLDWCRLASARHDAEAETARARMSLCACWWSEAWMRLLCEVHASTVASSDPPLAIQGTLHGRHGRSGLHLFWYVCHQGAVGSPLPYTSMCRHAMCICIGWLVGLGTCVCSIACAFGPHGSCGLAIIFRHAILALSIMLQLQAHGGGRGDALGGARPRETRARKKPRREKISRAPPAHCHCVSCVCACAISYIS